MSLHLPTRHQVIRWVRRVVLLAGALWFAAITIGSSFAVAEGFSGQKYADPVVSWMDLTDSHGVPIYAYQISGPSSALDPIDSLWVASAQFAFASYREVAAFAIWFLDWVTSFQWYELLNTPASSIGAKVSMMLGQLGVTEAFAAITGVAVMILAGRGKNATAVYELLATWTVAALATGVLANPLATVGGQDGWIMDTRGAALEMAGAVITPVEGDYVLDTRTGGEIDKPELNVSTDTEALQKQLTTTLVDTFVRQPAQLINYGKVLDRGGCEAVYTEATKDGPYTDADIPKDKVGDCDEEAGNFANSPGPHQALAAFILTPASLVILAMALLIGGAIMTSAAMILYLAIKLLWSTLQALLPGNARAGFFMAIGEIIACFIMLWFSIFILAVYEYIVTELFKDADSGALPKTFITADVILVVLLVIFVKQRDRIKASAARIAELLSQRPEGKIPAKTGNSWSPAQKLAAAAGTVGALARRRATRGGGSITNNSQYNFFGPGHGDDEETGTDPHVTVTQVPTTRRPQPKTVTRLAEITGRTLAHAALGHATGGISTAIRAAQRARQLQIAARHAAERRAALQGRITPAALPSAPQRRALGPGPAAPSASKDTPGSGQRPSGPRGPRPTPGGGLFGWLRTRANTTRGSFASGYTPIKTPGGDTVLLQPMPQGPRTRGQASAAASILSRLRRR